MEDDHDFRANLVEWLSGSGYAVAEESNGKEAMALPGDREFDVVVTDLKMPEADGLELLEWCKIMHPDTAVVFISGQATVRDAVQALGLIAERFREPVGLCDISRQLGYSAAYLTDALRREKARGRIGFAARST